MGPRGISTFDVLNATHDDIRLLCSYSGITYLLPLGQIKGLISNMGSLSNSLPLALGTANAGTASTASRSDHVHPAPSWSIITSKPTTVSGYGITDAATLSNAIPMANGIASAGVATAASRADHVHPAQSWETISNKPTTVSGYGITDAAVLGNSLPLGLGSASAGIASTASRTDHVHPAPSWNIIVDKPTTMDGFGITDGVTLSNSIPLAAGVGSAGIANTASRSDHVHPAGLATNLQTPRNINGTLFDGSQDITTATWGTARNITIGNATKSVNGSSDLTWTLAEIGTGSGGGGATIQNDISTNATRYPLFADATSGELEDIYTSDSKFRYNPDTGILTANAFNSLSDENYKENIKPLVGSLNKIRHISGYSFNFIGGERSIGVIAQEVEQVLPDIVETDSVDNKKTVNYNGIIALLVSAFNDHISRYENEIRELKEKIADLEAR